MKKTGICLQTLIAVRSNPSERAELITQLLFGETFSIEEVSGNWVRIINTSDNYDGWIDKKLVTHLTEDEYNNWNINQLHATALPFASMIDHETKTLKPIVAGSRLPISDTHRSFSIAGANYTYSSPFDIETSEENPIISISKKFLNAPYLWGGKSILGIDCSGLVQIVYSIYGINLPRDASKQIAIGKAINFTHEAIPGDLAFFDNEMGDIIHVGILLNNNEIIHSSGFVRIDSIDHQGIYNHQTNNYSHKLRIIKRIID